MRELLDLTKFAADIKFTLDEQDLSNSKRRANVTKYKYDKK